MGFGFLALAWNALAEPERGRWYLHRLENVATDTGELPESWCREPKHHQYYNSPLCWSHALHVIAASSLTDHAVGRAAAPHAEGRAEVVALPEV